MWTQYGQSQFANLPLAFDGRANIYAPTSLPQESYALEITLDDGGRPRKVPRVFRIKVKKVGVLSMALLRQFLDGQLNYTPHEILQAIEIILRQSPASKFTTVGRNFYTGGQVVKIPGGVEVWKGIFQSIRATNGTLLLNCDVSAATFIQSGSLVDLISDFLGKPPGSLQTIGDNERRRVESFCRALKVVTTHRDNKRKYKVLQLTPSSAEQTL